MILDGYPLFREIREKILEHYPSISLPEAQMLSGFAILYCLGVPDVRKFMANLIRGGLSEAKKINSDFTKKLKSEIDALKSNNSKILN